MSRKVSFLKVPVAFVDEDEYYHGFDLLLPIEDKSIVPNIVSWLINMRQHFLGEKSIDVALARLFDNQPYSCFNYVNIPANTNILNRYVKNGLTHILIEGVKIPLSDIEDGKAELSAKICFIIMNVYLSDLSTL